jgi:hypothetical protein
LFTVLAIRASTRLRKVSPMSMLLPEIRNVIVASDPEHVTMAGP